MFKMLSFVLWIFQHVFFKVHFSLNGRGTWIQGEVACPRSLGKMSSTDGNCEPRALSHQAMAVPVVTYSLLPGTRGPEETPGNSRDHHRLESESISTATLPLVRGLAIFIPLSSSFSPWTKCSWWSKQAKSSWQGPGEANADGMSSSGKCICRWEFFCVFPLSWLLTIGISFQVEFPALVWLLMEEIGFSMCISPELASRLPWMLLAAMLPWLCLLSLNCAFIIREACPGKFWGHVLSNLRRGHALGKQIVSPTAKIFAPLVCSVFQERPQRVLSRAFIWSSDPEGPKA